MHELLAAFQFQKVYNSKKLLAQNLNILCCTSSVEKTTVVVKYQMQHSGHSYTRSDNLPDK